MNILINIALFAGIAVVVFSRLKIDFKRIIAGSLIYIMYVNDTGFHQLKGIFGFSDHSLDIILTQIIFFPLIVWGFGSIILAVSGSLNRK